MTLFQALILGIVQGLTEFLPISSSAHLVIVPFLLNWHIPNPLAFSFDVLVQVGTLVAVIVFFWKDLWAILKAVVIGIIKRKPFADPQARLGWLIVLATIPAGILGLAIKKTVEAAFQSSLATGLFLFVTAAFLFTAEWLGKRQRPLGSVTWKDALWIGLFQAVSIFPGISRSGSTMAGGLVRNLERQAAARFSFIMSVPIMLAAGLLEAKDLISNPDLIGSLPVILVGFLTAAIVGYFVIRWLLAYLVTHSFNVFAYYCIAAGLITVAVSLLR